MFYQEYKPSKELADYIECYWLFKCPADQMATQELIIPGGRVEIMINLGTPVSFVSSTGRSFEFKTNMYVLGQRNTFFTTNFQPGNYMWGIRFRPAFFFTVCKLPTSQLLNEAVPANEIFKTINTSELGEKLINEGSHCVHELEAFLKRILYIANTPEVVIHQTLALIKGTHQHTSLFEFCAENKLYYKKMERQFLQCAGYTPKEFLNVRRFYHAVRLMYRSDRSLTDICHHLGFYDQSHFIKDFKVYTSLSPLQFKKREYQMPRLIASSANV
ncbi:helix-turn-helix domain-containing protein [Longitalea luteola]|uniref:helix-turn-helix domain-containing protein n=1 Tax=Longitalea luteola TaxID=2812563 RepID=UPI001A96AAA8|nr:helix-turn-helix domain-containing protein [Longitalea luteola]